jgi:hypothetical protein
MNGTLESEGGWLSVETRRTDTGDLQITVRREAEIAGLAADDQASVIVQQRDASGTWQDRNRLATDESNVFGICAARAGSRRVFPGVYVLQGVAASLRSGSENFVISGVVSSQGGVSIEDLISAPPTALSPGDSLVLTYSATEASVSPDGWFLLVGRSTEAAPAYGHRAFHQELPVAFRLGQNEPNPSSHSTTLRFELPKPSSVRLEVFDLLGRKVASLASGLYPAGFHAVVWDLKDAGGASVHPGVYVYRMTAGEFTAKRKMSVIP